ncbi:8-amino-7-oxononanoate synthase [bacterium]|nr:8-amino-7-oxononanoate synthase [bacterium]
MLRSILKNEIDNIKAKGLYRSLRKASLSTAENIVIGDKKYINFSSNNYLGLLNDPRLAKAAESAILKYGIGAGASRLLTGNTVLHEQLEKVISDFKKQEDAIVFPTGYMANLGVVSSIMDSRDDLIAADSYIHASLFDACRNALAAFKVYPHRNVNELAKILKRYYRDKRRILVITDGVFSMDGDLAPIKELGEVAKSFGAYLMVDDAHGTGVLGENGRGTAEYLGCEDVIDIHMGTLSKSCGVLGGFISGISELKEFLVNTARSLIYTTGIPPVLCACSIEAINIIKEEPQRRRKLLKNSMYLRKALKELGFDASEGVSHIIPVIIGENERVMEISSFLYDNGLIVPGIRYPTVPRNQSRLRISLQATHSDNDIDKLIEVMKDVAINFDDRLLTR